jgi:RimJ/RimL family protein N-acetyltransferase
VYQKPLYEDGEILLSGYSLEDVDDHATGEDEETARRFGWWPKRSTPETVTAVFKNWARDWEVDGATRTFAVRDCESSRLLGGCQIRHHDVDASTVTYWTAPQQRGRGIATRALNLLVEYATDQGLSDLACVVAVDNIASRHVAEAAGFRSPALYVDPAGLEMVRYRYPRQTT